MSEAATAGIYRVTVKGKFEQLSEQAMKYLRTAAPDHTRFKSAYTAEGTFVYDADVKFFSLRYEVRIDRTETPHAPADAAAEAALAEAQTFMTTMGFAHGELNVSVVDLATMWESAPAESL